jgi:hypothetical protein
MRNKTMREYYGFSGKPREAILKGGYWAHGEWPSMEEAALGTDRMYPEWKDRGVWIGCEGGRPRRLADVLAEVRARQTEEMLELAASL